MIVIVIMTTPFNGRKSLSILCWDNQGLDFHEWSFSYRNRTSRLWKEDCFYWRVTLRASKEGLFIQFIWDFWLSLLIPPQEHLPFWMGGPCRLIQEPSIVSEKSLLAVKSWLLIGPVFSSNWKLKAFLLSEILIKIYINYLFLFSLCFLSLLWSVWLSNLI